MRPLKPRSINQNTQGISLNILSPAIPLHKGLRELNLSKIVESMIFDKYGTKYHKDTVEEIHLDIRETKQNPGISSQISGYFQFYTGSHRNSIVPGKRTVPTSYMLGDVSAKRDIKFLYDLDSKRDRTCFMVIRLTGERSDIIKEDTGRFKKIQKPVIRTVGRLKKRKRGRPKKKIVFADEIECNCHLEKYYVSKGRPRDNLGKFMSRENFQKELNKKNAWTIKQAAKSLVINTVGIFVKGISLLTSKTN